MKEITTSCTHRWLYSVNPLLYTTRTFSSEISKWSLWLNQCQYILTCSLWKIIQQKFPIIQAIIFFANLLYYWKMNVNIWKMFGQSSNKFLSSLKKTLESLSKFLGSIYKLFWWYFFFRFLQIGGVFFSVILIIYCITVSVPPLHKQVSWGNFFRCSKSFSR